MITLDQYFGKFKYNETHKKNAEELLKRVNKLLGEYNGLPLRQNPSTGCYISGEQYGGFRPVDCPIGAPSSAHKTGSAVDIYDPFNSLDSWLTDKRLEQYDLYREHPSATPGWAHLSTTAPRSGRRTFYP